MDSKKTLQEIQDALLEATTESRIPQRVGGFLALISPEDPMIWVNYAVPVDRPTADDIKNLVAVFEKAERLPRLEFFTDLWPEVPRLLERGGFACKKRMPVMIQHRSEWHGLSASSKTKKVGPEDVRLLKDILGEAFGMPDASSDASTKAGLASGRSKAALAYLDGQAVAGGFAVGTPRIREIAGIGTLPQFRRRGAASSVIAHLLDEFFGEGGEIAWLTPGDDEAQALYERLGFVSVGEQVCYEWSA